jgi:enolase
MPKPIPWRERIEPEIPIILKRKEISKMTPTITTLSAMEILDSRGNPTIRVFCGLNNGIRVSASVPSDASTGENEAVELRDGDKKRYNGKGVLTAVRNVNALIAPEVIGLNPSHQRRIDRLMIDLDGTPGKGKLGAIATLAVSMAAARGPHQQQPICRSTPPWAALAPYACLFP